MAQHSPLSWEAQKRKLDKARAKVEKLEAAMSDLRAIEEINAIAAGEYEQIEQGKLKAQTNTIIEHNLDRRANRELRARYARLVYYYLVGYSGFVGLLILLSGFTIGGFSLPGSVLNFLVGSTAAAAIGLVYSVTSGLFGKMH